MSKTTKFTKKFVQEAKRLKELLGPLEDEFEGVSFMELLESISYRPIDIDKKVNPERIQKMRPIHPNATEFRMKINIIFLFDELWQEDLMAIIKEDQLVDIDPDDIGILIDEGYLEAFENEEESTIDKFIELIQDWDNHRPQGIFNVLLSDKGFELFEKMRAEEEDELFDIIGPEGMHMLSWLSINMPYLRDAGNLFQNYINNRPIK